MHKKQGYKATCTRSMASYETDTPYILYKMWLGFTAGVPMVIQQLGQRDKTVKQSTTGTSIMYIHCTCH